MEEYPFQEDWLKESDMFWAKFKLPIQLKSIRFYQTIIWFRWATLHIVQCQVRQTTMTEHKGKIEFDLLKPCQALKKTKQASLMRLLHNLDQFDRLRPEGNPFDAWSQSSAETLGGSFPHDEIYNIVSVHMVPWLFNAFTEWQNQANFFFGNDTEKLM